MFTQEELEYLRDTLGEDWAKRVMELADMANKGKALEKDLYDSLYKIYTEPEAKEHFIQAIKKAGLNYEVPEDPYEKQIKKLKEEVKGFKENIEQERIKKEIFELLEQYGIMPEEYEDLIKFQQDYGIKDGRKAIELYAQMKQTKKGIPELSPVHFTKEVLTNPASEEEVYKKTIQELQKIMRGGRY